MQKLERLVEKPLLRLLNGTESYFSLEEAFEPMADLIDNAERGVRIVSDLDEMSDPKITQALERASERGVFVCIAHGPELEESERILQLQREGKVELCQLDKRPRSHFMAVDGRHTMVEEFHLPQTQSRKLFIKHNTATLAQRLELDFKQRYGV